MRGLCTYDKYDKYECEQAVSHRCARGECVRAWGEARVNRIDIMCSPRRSSASPASAILVTSCSRLLRYERYERYGACGVRNTRRMRKPKPWACSRDGLGPTPRVPDRGTTGSGVSSVRRAERQKTLGGQVGLSPDSQRKLWEALLRAVTQPDWGRRRRPVMLCVSVNLTQRARAGTLGHTAGHSVTWGKSGPLPYAQSLTWRRTPPKKISQHRRGARLRRGEHPPSRWRRRAAGSSAA